MKLGNQQTIFAEIADCLRSRKEISAVYVFGSYASGRQRPESDVDIAILFELPDRAVISEKLEAFRLSLARILRKEVHIVAMNFAGEILLKQIFQKGRCILVNNPKQLALFRMTAYSKIAEFGYYRPMLEKGFVRKFLNG